MNKQNTPNSSDEEQIVFSENLKKLCRPKQFPDSPRPALSSPPYPFHNRCADQVETALPATPLPKQSDVHQNFINAPNNENKEPSLLGKRKPSDDIAELMLRTDTAGGPTQGC